MILKWNRTILLKISLAKKPYEGFFCMNEKIFYNSSHFKSKYPNRLGIEV